jgi:hypothetical protein
MNKAKGKTILKKSILLVLVILFACGIEEPKSKAEIFSAELEVKSDNLLKNTLISSKTEIKKQDEISKQLKKEEVKPKSPPSPKCSDEKIVNSTLNYLTHNNIKIDKTTLCKYSNQIEIVYKQNNEKPDTSLIFAIIYVESKFDEKAISSHNALGLMQILKDRSKIKREYKKEELLKWNKNIECGVRFFLLLKGKDLTETQALRRYNCNSNKCSSYSDKVLKVKKEIQNN